MVISDTMQFVFLHNPKCGGTSLRQTLLDFDTRNNFFWQHYDCPRLHRRIDKAHMSLEDMRIAFPDDYQLLDRYFVFAFVRNPYDRFVSAFNELKGCKVSSEMSKSQLDDYKQSINEFVKNHLSSAVFGNYFEFRHFVPQHRIICNNVKLKADFVGKIESLQADFETVVHLTKIPSSYVHLLGHQNLRNVGIESMEILEADAVDMIDRFYLKDFILFKYPMQGTVRPSSIFNIHNFDPGASLRVGAAPKIREVLAMAGFKDINLADVVVIRASNMMWTSKLILIESNGYVVHYDHRSKGTFTFKSGCILVDWEKHGSEKFEQRPDGSYVSINQNINTRN